MPDPLKAMREQPSQVSILPPPATEISATAVLVSDEGGGRGVEQPMTSIEEKPTFDDAEQPSQGMTSGGGEEESTTSYDEQSCIWPKSTKGRLVRVVAVGVILAGIAVAVVVPVVLLTGNKDDSSPTASSGVPKDTLSAVTERGVLRCGVVEDFGRATRNHQTGDLEGFSVDLCRAVAAAVFGPTGRVEFESLTYANRFQALHSGTVDLLASSDTHTMERDLFEPSTEAGFTFSVPYLYDGTNFAGRPPYGGCADSLNITSDCQDLEICVLDGTTWVPLVAELLPEASVVTTTTLQETYDKLESGECNVIVGEGFDTSEPIVRAAGYTGEYEGGQRLHSKEPLALVTRDGDPKWSDVVNWVLQGLLTAEEEGYLQLDGLAKSEHTFPPTDLFGEQYQNMFVDSLSVVGNYGEMYARHLEKLISRSSINTINAGFTGLLYSMPFGFLETVGPGPIGGGKIEQIRRRGFLKCGVARRAIFAEFDVESQVWSGFDVDFCRAVSAAIFDGVTNTVVFTDLPAKERFLALERGDVDLLSRITTVTFTRDALEPSASTGFSFSQPNFYDGLSIGGIPPFDECASQKSFEGECQELKICVNEGTTFEQNVRELFPEEAVVSRQSGELAAQGLAEGVCNAIAGGVIDVSMTNIREVGGYTGDYTASSRRFSKDPLALVTRQDDPQWASFVYWVVSALFYADEQGITSESANRMPVANLFGPQYARSFRDIVEAVGSFSEIYQRNVEAEVPRGGQNMVNKSPFGPQHFPLPGLF